MNHNTPPRPDSAGRGAFSHSPRITARVAVYVINEPDARLSEIQRLRRFPASYHPLLAFCKSCRFSPPANRRNCRHWAATRHRCRRPRPFHRDACACPTPPFCRCCKCRPSLSAGCPRHPQSPWECRRQASRVPSRPVAESASAIPCGQSPTQGIYHPARTAHARTWRTVRTKMGEETTRSSILSRRPPSASA